MYGGSRLPTITNEKAHGYNRERPAFLSDSIEIVEISVHLEKQKTLLYYMFNFLFYSSTVLILIIGFSFCFILGCKDRIFWNIGEREEEDYF